MDYNILRIFRRLEIYKNKINQLDHLPPSLYELNCSNNRISKIDNLPKHLGYFYCNDNKLSSIENLPNSLIVLYVFNNQMTHLPKLPDNLKVFNYFNNPIPFNELPIMYQNVPCDNPNQNCKWNILNSVIKDSSFEITGLRIILPTSDGNHKIDFKIIDKILAAKDIKVEKITYEGFILSIDTDYVYYYIEPVILKNIITDVFQNKTSIQINQGDSVINVNLKIKRPKIIKTKKVGEPQVIEDIYFTDCTDGGYFGWKYFIYTKTDTIELGYSSNDCFNIDDLIYAARSDLKPIIDWIYMYKITNLTFPDNEFTKFIFNRNNLDKLITWNKLNK